MFGHLSRRLSRCPRKYAIKCFVRKWAALLFINNWCLICAWHLMRTPVNSCWRHIKTLTSPWAASPPSASTGPSRLHLTWLLPFLIFLWNLTPLWRAKWRLYVCNVEYLYVCVSVLVCVRAWGALCPEHSSTFSALFWQGCAQIFWEVIMINAGCVCVCGGLLCVCVGRGSWRSLCLLCGMSNL